MPLTKEWVEQAERLAQNVVEQWLMFDAIYSSPLQRAYKTAETVSNKLWIALPIIDELLIERDFGKMTGKPISSIRELCSPDILETEKIVYFLNSEWPETFDMLLERWKSILNKIRSKYNDGNILLVCHGDIASMIYAAFYDIPWKEVLQTFYFANAELLLLENK